MAANSTLLRKQIGIKYQNGVDSQDNPKMYIQKITVSKTTSYDNAYNLMNKISAVLENEMQEALLYEDYSVSNAE